MKSLICKYCGHEMQFQETHPPAECENCLSAIQLNGHSSRDTSLSDSDTRKHPEGFSLISQKDGSVITFLHADTMLLGRNHQGKEYFAAIPQISRSHAKIEFYDNHYRITDMNSSNGTFLGVEKINCKMHPAQSLKDGEILFLGREAFLIQINTRQKYDSQKDAGVFVKIRNANPENLIGNAPAADADHASERKKPYIPAQEFVCKNCYNYKSEIKEFTCPLCNTYNS